MKTIDQLPVYQYRSRILQTVNTHQVTIIGGEPGCGKSTVIPQLLLGAYEGTGNIAVTQPRRLAARTVAQYVANQMGVKIGTKVGHKVRFDAVFSSQTKLTFMTEGTLLRELEQDPFLRRFQVVILDEVHERSVQMDLCLGLMKMLLAKRPEMRLVLMSATLDLEQLVQFFDRPPVIRVLGKCYPVSMHYLESTGQNITHDIVQLLRQLCSEKENRSKKQARDILVFLPGEGEIAAIARQLKQNPIPASRVLPLHASLRSSEQDKVFQWCEVGTTKIVLATNIAETSVTVLGISTVIDSGLIREIDYDHESGISSLRLVSHSQAGCDQRAGRAGRTQTGSCYRLFSIQDFRARRAFTTPAICRTNLAEIYLRLVTVGVNDPSTFPFLDAPDKEALHKACEVLTTLGALDEKGALTVLGERIVRLPIDPRLAVMLLTAAEVGCVDEALTISAVFSCRSFLVSPRDELETCRQAQAQFCSEGSDCLAAVNIFRAWQEANCSDQWCYDHYVRADVMAEIFSVRQQLRNILSEREGLTVEQGKVIDPSGINLALITAFGDQLWHHTASGYYEKASGESCVIHRQSAAFSKPPEWFICIRLLHTSCCMALGVHPVIPADVAAALSGDVKEVYLPGRQYSRFRDAVVTTRLIPEIGGSTGEVVTVTVVDQEAVEFLAKALAESRLSTTATEANRFLLRELDTLRNKVGEQHIPFISVDWLAAFYRERLAHATSLEAAEKCNLLLTSALLKREFNCDLKYVRTSAQSDYPDTLVVNGRLIPVEYNQTVAKVKLEASFVSSLSYDMLVLPGGSPVQIEMSLVAAGSQERSVTNSSILELKQGLAEQAATVVSLEDLQRTCDRLRRLVFTKAKQSPIHAKQDPRYRDLLGQVEAALYAWQPNLEEGNRLLGELQTLLQ